MYHHSSILLLLSLLSTKASPTSACHLISRVDSRLIRAGKTSMKLLELFYLVLQYLVLQFFPLGRISLSQSVKWAGCLLSKCQREKISNYFPQLFGYLLTHSNLEVPTARHEFLSNAMIFIGKLISLVFRSLGFGDQHPPLSILPEPLGDLEQADRWRSIRYCHSALGFRSFAIFDTAESELPSAW